MKIIIVETQSAETTLRSAKSIEPASDCLYEAENKILISPQQNDFDAGN